MTCPCKNITINKPEMLQVKLKLFLDNFYIIPNVLEESYRQDTMSVSVLQGNLQEFVEKYKKYQIVPGDDTQLYITKFD